MKWLPHHLVCLQKETTHTTFNEVHIQLYGIVWNKSTLTNHLVEYI